VELGGAEQTAGTDKVNLMELDRPDPDRCRAGHMLGHATGPTAVGLPNDVLAVVTYPPGS
jgi:hypothetical protein